MGTRHDVELEGHGGVVLRGWLHLPDPGTASGAGVVMAHGFSAVKEMRLDRFAEVFCDAGLAVLIYDHRNFGASDGEPRQQINPWAQARDYRHALHGLGNRPRSTPTGSGCGDPATAAVRCWWWAPVTDRVKAVVANVPFAGLPGVDYNDPTTSMAASRASATHCSMNPAPVRPNRDRPTGGPMAVVLEEGDDRPAFLPQPESSEYFLSSPRAGRNPPPGATTSPSSP